ncbi:hypothetical protein DL766_009660 [Monosporascus sp. MC13-8B]|uniref:Uncharacterized protein n=1 Tax=Monosporascus cannonballus TaxID=155416 RepID=A0ABY0HAP5_9PEZI|nr:hypothetical protein DL763_006760 [Monosporascus cannonballus]RYO89102.1 hypothetical protein DL762_003382 [Monosporascus cannonballus]RYP14483.1 hypothetical protein DL766_009660 [Monosporascus sp. MC13-8B]
MPSTINNDEWDLPRLKASIGFEDDFQYLSSDDQDTEFFDVKFYPYGDESHDPVFAAVSKKHKEAMNCSCTWTKDPETEAPYLCIAGRDAKVKVYDVIEGKLVKVLTGHGGEINDLATSPTNFLLIASASDDTTVRIWSLDPKDAKQPCVALLAGEGHSSHLLTVAFHDNGRYVLSAGHDNVVCLWTLPDFATARATDKNPPPPVVIHYPHFFTSEVHSGIVDCVAFFGDLVLSRACHEDIIVLWRIEGFSSDNPIPSPSDAPTTSDTERLTRSAFAPATGSQYARLLQFHTPGCGHQFYLRFKLFHRKDKNPVLAFGNAHSEIYFWDLARLIGYHNFILDMNDSERDKNQPIQRPGWLQPIRHRKQGDAISKLKDASDRDSVVSGRSTSLDVQTHGDLNNNYTQETLESWEAKYDMTRVEDAIKAHATSKLTIKDFVGRQVAWNATGEWCVVVGSKNLAIILQRWDKKLKVDEEKSTQ